MTLNIQNTTKKICTPVSVCRVAKCKIFYTDQSIQTRFYPQEKCSNRFILSLQINNLCQKSFLLVKKCHCTMKNCMLLSFFVLPNLLHQLANFHSNPHRVGGRVYKLKICLFVCHHFETNIGPGSRLTPHIIYCWAGDDENCQLAMSMTHTNTNTQTKRNTKCFKDPMHVIFLKSRGC